MNDLLMNAVKDENASIVMRLSVPILHCSKIISYSALTSYRDLKRLRIPVFFETDYCLKHGPIYGSCRNVIVRTRRSENRYDLTLCHSVMLLPGHALIGVEEDLTLPEGFVISGSLRHKQGIRIRVQLTLGIAARDLPE